MPALQPASPGRARGRACRGRGRRPGSDPAPAAQHPCPGNGSAAGADRRAAADAPAASGIRAPGAHAVPWNLGRHPARPDEHRHATAAGGPRCDAGLADRGAHRAAHARRGQHGDRETAPATRQRRRVARNAATGPGSGRFVDDGRGTRRPAATRAPRRRASRPGSGAALPAARPAQRAARAPARRNHLCPRPRGPHHLSGRGDPRAGWTHRESGGPAHRGRAEPATIDGRGHAAAARAFRRRRARALRLRAVPRSRPDVLPGDGRAGAGGLTHSAPATRFASNSSASATRRTTSSLRARARSISRIRARSASPASASASCAISSRNVSPSR